MVGMDINGDDVGGLVGSMRSGTLTASYATGDVNVGNGYDDHVGGLVGSMWSGTLTASYATGTVNGGFRGWLGGLYGKRWHPHRQLRHR